MMVFSAAGPAGRPVLGRAAGARRTDRGEVDLFVSRAPWGAVVDDLAPGARFAVTFSRPADYRTMQLKGVLTALAPATAADAAAAATYVAAVTRSLLDLGVLQSQADQWLTCEDLVTLRLRPGSIFAQTPGPDAGMRLAGDF